MAAVDFAAFEGQGTQKTISPHTVQHFYVVNFVVPEPMKAAQF
jgi:hypothetical protein